MTDLLEALDQAVVAGIGAQGVVASFDETLRDGAVEGAEGVEDVVVKGREDL